MPIGLPWVALAATDRELACVYPVADLREHQTFGSKCWCQPIINDGVVIHNAMDQREKYERGERRPS